MKLQTNKVSNKHKFMTDTFKTIKCSVCGKDITVVKNFPGDTVVCDECD